MKISERMNHFQGGYIIFETKKGVKHYKIYQQLLQDKPSLVKQGILAEGQDLDELVKPWFCQICGSGGSHSLV